MENTVLGLGEFLAAVRRGEHLIAGGGPTTDGKLWEGKGAIDSSDIEAVVAEAYNAEVFLPDKDWDEAVKEVREAIAVGAVS